MSISNDKLHRELGEQGQRLEALEEAMEKNTAKLDELLAWKSELTGGRKAILIAISAAATVGGLISWVMTHLAWKS